MFKSMKKIEFAYTYLIPMSRTSEVIREVVVLCIVHEIDKFREDIADICRNREYNGFAIMVYHGLSETIKKTVRATIDNSEANINFVRISERVNKKIALIAPLLVVRELPRLIAAKIAVRINKFRDDVATVVWQIGQNHARDVRQSKLNNPHDNIVPVIRLTKTLSYLDTVLAV
jgi:hypothetical protein